MDPTPEGQAKFEKIFIPQAFLQDWKLFGDDQFKLQIIARLPGSTTREDLGKEEELYTAEAIEQKGRHMVYNQCLGNHKSPKAIKMMSESNLGKPKSAEQRKKMSESHKARWAAMKAAGYQRPDKGRARGPRKSAPQHP